MMIKQLKIIEKNFKLLLRSKSFVILGVSDRAAKSNLGYVYLNTDYYEKKKYNYWFKR